MPKDMRRALGRLRSEPDRIRERKGKGDHVNFKVEGARELITVDAGRKQMSDKAYRKICEIAGWDE